VLRAWPDQPFSPQHSWDRLSTIAAWGPGTPARKHVEVATEVLLGLVTRLPPAQVAIPRVFYQVEMPSAGKWFGDHQPLHGGLAIVLRPAGQGLGRPPSARRASLLFQSANPPAFLAAGIGAGEDQIQSDPVGSRGWPPPGLAS